MKRHCQNCGKGCWSLLGLLKALPSGRVVCSHCGARYRVRYVSPQMAFALSLGYFGYIRIRNPSELWEMLGVLMIMLAFLAMAQILTADFILVEKGERK
jgi:hypothetical protein